jgi:hypothetical protein
MREAAFKHAFGIPAFNKIKKEMKAGSKAYVYQVDFIGIPCLMAVSFGKTKFSDLPPLEAGQFPPEELPDTFYPEGNSHLVGEVDFGRTGSDSD